MVQRDGKVVLHSDPGALFKPFVRDELMDKMTSGEGQLYDPGSDTRYYYYSFTNPDWFVIFRVDNATTVNLTRHETNLVIGGFTLAAIIIILFGLYLRHASRTVLMNIINAIKTGDVKRAPRLEAMLSKAIETNKQRELSYVRRDHRRSHRLQKPPRLRQRYCRPDERSPAVRPRAGRYR